METDEYFLVSVNIITYNHEKYIAQAIEGVLMQKTDFNYEIVICDDFSTDSTRSILEAYQNIYPNNTKLRFRQKNLGLKYNYFDNIEACTGKYVAICEGDDFWTDPYKLQKQIDFLEANLNYSMCFHSALELHEHKNTISTSNVFSQLQERDYSGNEILSTWLVPTASVVFRKNSPFNFQFMDKFLFYDIILFLRLYEDGKIFCINQVMCVYRRHPNSITNSNLSYSSYIRHLKYLNAEFNNKYSHIIKKAIATEYLKRAKYRFKQKSAIFLVHIFRSIYYNFNPFYSMILTKIKL